MIEFAPTPEGWLPPIEFRPQALMHYHNYQGGCFYDTARNAYIVQCSCSHEEDYTKTVEENPKLKQYFK